MKKVIEKGKHEACRKPLTSDATIFQKCHLIGVSRNKRCKVLRDMVKVRKKAETRPPIIKINKLNTEIGKEKKNHFFLTDKGNESDS